MRHNKPVTGRTAGPGEMIRVLWLIKGLGPGGAEQLLVSSAQVASQRRIRYHVAYIRADKDQLVPALARAGVGATLLHGRIPVIGWAHALRELMRGVDIVHAHSPLPAAVARVLARTLPRSQRPITVSTEHNVWPNFAAPTRIANAVTAPLDACRWAVSEEVRRSMWPRLRDSAPALRHGIVLASTTVADGTRERMRAELGIPADAVVAITVANLRKEKDYPNLLRAAQLSIAEHPGLYFLAVGQGPLADQVAAERDRLALGDRFWLLGYRTDVPELLAASDLFVLGSTQEGLPVAIMESLAAGLPVVATDVGGVSEAVRPETGLLVPASDSRALADAVVRLSRDRNQRSQLSSGARALAPMFDIRTAVAAQEAAYAQLASP